MKTKLQNKFLLGLLLTIHNVGFGQGRDDKPSPDGAAPAVQNSTVRTLDDLRAELKKKNSVDNMGGEGMSSGMSGMAMPSGPGMGGPAGGLGMGGSGMGSSGMGAGGLGAPGMGAGPGGMGPGMSGGMSGPGGMYGGMGSEGGYDGMGGGGAVSERQLLAQMIQKLSQRLQSKKYKRETVEKQLRNALAQYFNADMEERLQEFDKVKAKVSELETKLQKRLERESEIIDLQLKQMLHKADGLDFSIPAGLDSGAMEGAMGGFGSGMGDGYGSEGSSGSMAGMPGISGGYSVGMAGG